MFGDSYMPELRRRICMNPRGLGRGGGGRLYQFVRLRSGGGSQAHFLPRCPFASLPYKSRRQGLFPWGWKTPAIAQTASDLPFSDRVCAAPKKGGGAQMLSVDGSGHCSPPDATVGLHLTLPEGPPGLLLARRWRGTQTARDTCLPAPRREG